MKRTDLDRVLGPTPPEFSGRVSDTLRVIQEEPKVRKKRVSRALVIALILILIAGVAFALAVTQGQNWYYHNRFTAYQNNEPEKQQAILDHLSTNIPQTQADASLVTVTVQDASWTPENGVATLSFAIRPQNPDVDELHPLGSLDEDGYWDEVADPDDPNIRTERWLWTDKGYGLPSETMADPSKRLLLFSGDNASVYIGADGNVALPLSVTDSFVGDDGDVICVLEFDMTQLDAEKVREQFDAFVYDPDRGIPEAEWKENTAAQLQSALDYAQAADAAVATATDENGMLTLRYDYTVVPLIDNELLDDQAGRGETVFQIKVAGRLADASRSTANHI
jgi:hypothetical protein